MNRTPLLAASLTLTMLAAIAPIAGAQSRSSFVAGAAANRSASDSFLAFASDFSSSGSRVTASGTQSYSGRDSYGAEQTMTFAASASAESDFGRLRTRASGTVTNPYYNPENPLFYDGNSDFTTNPEGSPDAFLTAGVAGFTDALSFGGGAMAGYRAQYVFFVDGTVTGSGVHGVLNAKIGDNAAEEFVPDLATGRVAQTFATRKYAIDSLRQQTADVTFTTRFDADLVQLPEGVTFAGTGDFSSTITLTAILLYDGNDALVSNYTVGGASGTSYPTSPVPEPATLAVLGVGAAAILRRRRRV